MLSCWIFCVVSSAQQGDSLPEQERDLRARAATQGWNVDRVFADDSTGKHGPRRLIRQMVAALRDLRADERPAYVVMNRLDRFGRGRIVDSQIVLAELGDLNVKVWTREQGFVANETWTDELINAVRFAVARQENEARADRSRAGRARRRNAGLHVSANAPFGCVIVEGRAIAREPEASFVRELFRLRAARWGYDRLARFASQHAPPKQLKDGREKRYRWGRSTIQRMFKVETLRELVVPVELWDEVQATRNPDFKAARVTSWPWPLRGAIRCTCGALMTGVCTGRKGYRYRNYVCRHVERHGNYPFHRADAVERAFVEILGRLQADPTLLVPPPARPDVEAQLSELRNLETFGLELDARRSKAWSLAEAAAIAPEQLRARLDEIDAERARVDARIKDLRTQQVRTARATTSAQALAEVLDGLAQLWPDADPAHQQEIAIAVAELVGGLWLEPERKGEILTGYDAAIGHISENMREINSLRDAQMAQRKADDGITKKFIESIGG